MLSLTVANALAPLSAVATAPVLAHSLGVVGRGEVAAASAPYLLATAVATFGVPDSVTYFVARKRIGAAHALRQAMRFVLLSGTVVAGALIAVSGWLSNGDPHIQRLIAVGALAIVPSLCVGVLRGTAGGLQLWPLVVRERVLTASLRLVAILGLAAVSQLTTTAASMIVVLTPVAGAVSYLRLRRHVTGADRSPDLGRTGIVSYGARVWVGSISGVLLLRLDQAIMAPLSSARELGLYAIAAAISEIPLITTAAMRDVIFAADAARESADRLAATARLSGFIAVAIGAAISLTLPLWITVVFGAGFRDALPVAWLLTGAVVLGAPGSIIGAGLSARGRPGLRSACLVVACLVNLALILTLVPQHGALGAAVATLFGNATAGTLAAVFMWRVFDISPRPFYGIRGADLRLLIGVLRSFLRSLTVRAAPSTVPLP